MPALARGDVWLVDLNPPGQGHEQHGVRPALIVSVDPFNSSALGLVVVVPLTSRNKGFPSHVAMRPPEAGLKVASWIKCEDIRSIAASRLASRWGSVRPTTMAAVEMNLRRVLGL